MIAACPKCQTRYRVEADRLGADGARLRCSNCSAVFRVRLPEATPPGVAAAPAPVAASPPVPAAAPAPAPAASVAAAPPVRAPARVEAGPQFDRERLVLVAHPDPDACKRLAEALESHSLQTMVAHDGVEAMLSIQRALPRAVVLDAALPKMFGFQVCEIVKRNDSLRATHVCLMGAIHKEDRYRRAPNELYGADFYVEPPDLPDALVEWLARVGLPMPGRAPVPEPPRAAPEPAPAPAAVTAAPPPSRTPAPPAKLTLGRVGSPPDALGAERAQAERLARIIVSDIVLYNEEKFTAAVRSGSPLEALRDELEEGRALFRERIDARVREERDFLAEELLRVARTRGSA
jgi:predicted Zn finger-like uncharacterized protein